MSDRNFSVRVRAERIGTRAFRRHREKERGQIMVLFSLMVVVVLAFASIAIDLGVLRNNRQTLVNAVDAGALAGGTLMPLDGSVAGAASAADSLIKSTINVNYPGITSSQYTIVYKCLIGVDASTPPAPYVSRDVPSVCNPGPSHGWTGGTTAATKAAAFNRGAGQTRYSTCDPTLGDKCNTVLVTASADMRFAFGPVVGVNSGSTGAVQAAACNGPCGTSPLTPVDVMLVMDRTGSMSGSDTTNAKNAANSIVSLYNPAVQWLGLGLLGPSTNSGACIEDPAGSIGTANAPTDLRRWVPVGLSGTGSTFGTTYAKVTAGITCYTNSGTGTDLADPMAMATYELLHNGRTGVRKGIIFETDGQPNTQTASGTYTSTNNCANMAAAANAAKAAGIEVFTIGFGLDSSVPNCPDTSGTWKGKTPSSLLVYAATAPSVDGGCPGTSNTDGDHYFCIAKTAGVTPDLSAVFQAAAAQLAKGENHLVQLDPYPIVNSVSPSLASHTGGATVTISGIYFTGATSVKFGGTNATSFTVSSDTTISATVPAGSIGSTVDILVTSAGGTSPIVAGDRLTYN